MREPMTQALRAEMAKYRLVAACEDCGHYIDARNACAVLYPVESQRRAAFEQLPDGAPVPFCKMFEAR